MTNKAQRVEIDSDHKVEIPQTILEELLIDAVDGATIDIMDGLIVIIPDNLDPVGRLSGLGSDIWKGEDAQDYVNRLRDEW